MKASIRLALILGAVAASGFVGIAACESAVNEFTYENLVTTINDNKVKRINELLEKLPDGLRANFLLIPKTQSRQRRASDDKPRIVLFDGPATDYDPDTAHFIMAFEGEEPNGDQAGNAQEDVEVIRYRDACKCFDFFRILFRKAGGTWQAPTFEDGGQGHAAKPRGCKSCHRGAAAADDLAMRPNFSTYPSWTSIYGTDVDFIFDGKGGKERAAFEKFLKKGRTTLRYGKLVDLVTTADVKKGVPLPTHRNLGRALGMVFHQAISSLNVRRMVRFMMTSPDYACYKYAIQGALKEACKDEKILDFIPLSRQRNHTADYDALVTQTEKQQDGYYRLKLKELVESGMGKEHAQSQIDSPSRRDEEENRYRIAKLRYLFEKRCPGSISIEHFALILAPDSYAFAAAQSVYPDLAAQFAAASGLGNRTCAQLKTDAANDAACADAVPNQCDDTHPCACQSGQCAGTEGCHFECYTTTKTPTAPIAVHLVDQFGAADVLVSRPLNLCTPADKSGESPAAESASGHLQAYEIVRDPSFTPVTNVSVANQFGEIVVDAIRRDRLLVPSAKDLSVSPPPLSSATGALIDDFECYRIKRSRGGPRFKPIQDVQLLDQFGAATVKVTKPRLLCNPVDKDGETPGAEEHPVHLACYTVKTVSGSEVPAAPVFINNEFGAQIVHAARRDLLCIPSFKSP